MKKKLGLALGGGFAKGISHIGVLKVLHQNNLRPDYIAGTSVGAIIGAIYAAGHSPEEMEKIVRALDWKKMVDFTIPKFGLIKGQLVENRLKRLIGDKSFADLTIPLRVVAVNLDTKEKVVFSRGNVAKAVHASAAFPGIFNPVRIGAHHYIDGGIADPTPFDVVREMGADIVLAVDLTQKSKNCKGLEVKGTTLFDELKKKFIAEELLNLRDWLTPKKFPEFVIRLFQKFFDWILYPQKILRILAKRETPPIIKIIQESNNILHSNLAKERLKNADIDFLISLSGCDLTWKDFDKIDEFLEIGEKEAWKIIPKLKKELGR